MERAIPESEAAFVREKRWQEPNYPYILFKLPYLKMIPDGEKRLTESEELTGKRAYMDLWAMNVGGTLRQPQKVQKLI